MSIETFKICLVGDARVGKTTFTHALLSNKFKQTYSPTLGVDLDVIIRDIGGEKIRFNIWDCAGDKNFQGLKDGYYLKANAFIVMFDVSKPLDEFKKIYKEISKKNVPILVVGNKIDLNPTFDWSKIECKDKIGISTKSLSGLNVVFERLAQLIE